MENGEFDGKVMDFAWISCASAKERKQRWISRETDGFRRSTVENDGERRKSDGQRRKSDGFLSAFLVAVPDAIGIVGKLLPTNQRSVVFAEASSLEAAPSRGRGCQECAGGGYSILLKKRTPMDFRRKSAWVRGGSSG